VPGSDSNRDPGGLPAAREIAESVDPSYCGGESIMDGPNRSLQSFLLVLCLFTLVMLYVGERFSAVRLVGEIQHLHQTRARLEGENARLRIEQDDLLSPGRIEQLAARTLGMKYPNDGQMVYLWTSDQQQLQVALLSSSDD
jgi:cell division protein FtsL